MSLETTPNFHRVVAIDGPAASGKSTVSRQVASRLGFVYVNSGAMYRAVTWAVLEAGVDPSNAGAVRQCVDGLKIDCTLETDANGQPLSVVKINGVDPGDALRSETVNASVSPVASVPEVRSVLVARQRDYATVSDIVMEGRDIGSVVFADTPYKFFLDAAEEVREARRQAEGGFDPISERDRQDSARKASPMVVADDAVVVDTSEMEIDQVVEHIESLLRDKGL
jgi:cytidylate kinase